LHVKNGYACTSQSAPVIARRLRLAEAKDCAGARLFRNSYGGKTVVLD
jgi:hypothetical protein